MNTDTGEFFLPKLEDMHYVSSISHQFFMENIKYLIVWL